MDNFLPNILTLIQRIGQAQLLRKEIHQIVQFNCKMDANLLFLSLDVFNQCLIQDIKRHELNPENTSYPDQKNNSLLMDTCSLLESCGLDDVADKVYITSHPLEGLPVLLLLFIITYLPKVPVFNLNFLYFLFISRWNMMLNSEY